jgi:putative endonuclease
MHYVYVLQGDRDRERFYIGYTSDLRARLAQHNDGKNRSTAGQSWQLVYYEAYLARTAAAARERILKHDGRSRRALMERIRSGLVE